VLRLRTSDAGWKEAQAVSIQKKLDRVRKPRVHIKYEVETGGAMVEKELPFVMGVMGDFSGQPTEPLKPLKDRKFVQIDRDNFNEVMAKHNAGLNLRVENKLAADGSEMAVNLKFSKIEDFEPGAVADQVEPLRKLLHSRNQLRDLAAQLDRSPEELENALESILKNTENVEALAKKLGIEASAAGGGETKEE
jgi:type VI secretion system protein ImpB